MTTKDYTKRDYEQAKATGSAYLRMTGCYSLDRIGGDLYMYLDNDQLEEFQPVRVPDTFDDFWMFLVRYVPDLKEDDI